MRSFKVMFNRSKDFPWCSWRMFGKFICIFEFEIGQIQGLAREVFMQSTICQTTQRKRVLADEIAGLS